MKNKIIFLNLLNVSILFIPFLVSAQYVTPAFTGLPTGNLTSIIIGVMNWLLVILGILGVIGFVIAGILYLTAAGNDDQMKRAKNAMTWSIIGVIVGLMGYVIIQAVDSMLNGSSSF
jgi:ABC-type transport system involved in cytochrome bd biosynthesis fused ATPase/permease subunit